MLDWDDFKYFTAIARNGTVRAAGQALGVHASTVTRRLEQLEQRLGMRLFARARTGLVITPEGAEVVQALEDVAARLEGIERRLRGRDTAMAGPVRINVPEVFRGELFMSEIGEFSRRHPDVVVEASAAWQPPDLDKREADLSVVLTDDPPGHLVGRQLGQMTLGAYRHVEVPAERKDCWLSSALEFATGPEFAARVFPARKSGGYLQSMDLQLAAALAGMGSTLLPDYLGAPHPQLARVSGLGEVDDDVRLSAWLLSHPDSRGVARVQAVAELLIETLRTRNLQSEGEH